MEKLAIIKNCCRGEFSCFDFRLVIQGALEMYQVSLYSWKVLVQNPPKFERIKGTYLVLYPREPIIYLISFQIWRASSLDRMRGMQHDLNFLSCHLMPHVKILPTIQFFYFCPGKKWNFEVLFFRFLFKYSVIIILNIVHYYICIVLSLLYSLSLSFSSFKF